LKLPGGPSPFTNWFVLDVEGQAVARWPQPPQEFLARNFGWRDYYQGARRLGLEGRRVSYVSRPFRSEADNHYRLAISAPIHDARGNWVGIVVGMMATGSTLGSLSLNDIHAQRRTAVLVALRDRSRSEATAPLPDEYIVLLHDGMERGDTTPLGRETTGRLEEARARLPEARGAQLRMPEPWPTVSLAEHEDPLASASGPWLAAFAPVGYTGMGVIVQTRSEAALAPDKALARRLVLWGGLPFLLWEALLAVLLWRSRRL
jgi:serine/threonine-protein kinase